MIDLHRASSSVRRLATIVTLVVAMAVVPAVAASADRGFTFVDEFSFDDVHPCTGQPRTVDATYTVTVHDHPNLTLLRIEMDSVASDGTVERGTQTITDHVEQGVVRGGFNAVHVDDAGNRFIAHVRFAIDDSGVSERRSYACTGKAA